MRLITNIDQNTQSHLFELRNLMASFDQIFLCSGWMKRSGLSHLLCDIRGAANRGAEITVFSNLKHTQRSCTNMLAKVIGLKHHRVALPLCLHTKLYYGRRGNRYRAILGSANITSGGLWESEELSYLIDGHVGDEAYLQLAPYLQKLSSLAQPFGKKEAD